MPNPSIKHERIYRALRRRGYSQQRAAAISNAQGMQQKAQTDASRRAMFAKLGGGFSGGSPGAGKQLPDRLWAKNPDTGKREAREGLQREADEGLFGRDYRQRQAELKKRTPREIKHESREAFFEKQLQARTPERGEQVSKFAPPEIKITPKLPGSSDTRSSLLSTLFPGVAGLNLPLVDELDEATKRYRAPETGWNLQVTSKQEQYVTSLLERAKKNCPPGSLAEKIANDLLANRSKFTRWEASQLIDAMKKPKPMTTLYEDAKLAAKRRRAGSDRGYPGMVLFSLPEIRARVVNEMIIEDYRTNGNDDEGMPF